MSEEYKKALERFDYLPVSETLELDVDLSTAGYVNVTEKKFDFITNVRLVLIVADAAMEYTEFAEAVTLANGFYFHIDEVMFGSLIKTAGDLAKLGTIRFTASDADAVKVAYIRQVEIDFTKMTPQKLGIMMRKPDGAYRTFGVYGQDDMTAAVKFQAIIEGYKMV